MKIFISLAFSLIVFLAYIPQVQAQTPEAETVSDYETATAATTATTTVTNGTVANTTIAVKVKGVGCGSDIALIKANVEKLAGVQECAVVKHGAITSFDVTYNPQEAVMKDIHAAIEDTGCCKDPDARPYKVKL